MKICAHSLSDPDETEWELLSDHLSGVGDRAGDLAAVFGWTEAARAAGLLHDIGKCSAEFQAYIRGQRPTGGDHSTAGAKVAATVYPGWMGRLLAYAVAGHHAGLADADGLDGRLDGDVPDFAGWEAHAGPLAPLAKLTPTGCFEKGADKGFHLAFLARMLFSCLVDADFLETERFYAEAEGGSGRPEGGKDLSPLRNRLRAYMDGKRAEADSTLLNSLRAEVLNHAIGRAELTPGLFTLTVPTGGGKTLASLSFALEHAVRHGLRRVVYVIPYTSIIEQTAGVFREALDAPDEVLEHHASFDWERAAAGRADDRQGDDPLAKLRRAAENWDAPVVVTTAVQFFESLFAARTSSCRKLHNLARAVIVLDEAQTLPVHLLRPCMAALDELARNYGASVVLCTATQPALREVDGFKHGFKIDEARELAPDPPRLYAKLKRVQVEQRPGKTTDAEIAARFADQPQMLCIVNRRAHARVLFVAIRGMEGAVHLTTLMCPRHRSLVLEDLRARLKAGAPVRLVATSLIEAGVDIDFPEVWRATAGLDSIAQATGRCNREGRAEFGRTVVFEPAEGEPPRTLKLLQEATRTVLRRHDDPLTLEAVHAYFGELYWRKGDEALDAATLEGRRYPILQAIAERATDARFPFASIAAAFRMIDDVMEPVIVPWRADADDREAETLLNRIAAMDRPLSPDLRRLQQYTVTIPPRVRSEWLTRGVLRPVHPKLGDALLGFEDLAMYDPPTGVRIDDLGFRAPESNVI